MASRTDYYSVLTDCVNDLADNGYTPERLAFWQDKLRRAAEASFLSMAQMESQMRDALGAVYARMIRNGGATKYHPGLPRFTLDKLRPELQIALQRRQAASRDLIKLNRVNAIAHEEQRLAGWASSLPPGGSGTVARVATKQAIRKSLASLPYRERFVIIDQSHRLAANINETIAVGGGAIAVEWHDHGATQKGYDYRPNHLERDGKIYLMKDSWALGQGLVKAGPAGYYQDVTGFAVEINCRCYGRWLYNLRQLPEELLTIKGREALRVAKDKISAL